MQRLDSDTPGADDQLHVTFYNKVDKKEDGTPGEYDGKPFVKILVPGDKTTVIDQPVREDHKQRFPRHWLNFHRQNAPDAGAIGTPLDEWHQDAPKDFTRGNLEEMLVLKFQTVEQIAQASDSQLQRIGMGGAALREKARRYLMRRSSQIGNAESEKRDREIEELKAQVAQLTALATQPSGKPNVVNNDAATHAAGNK